VWGGEAPEREAKGAQGGEEVQGGAGDRPRRTLAGATLMILGGIGNLPGLGIIVPSIPGGRRVRHVSDQALSRLCGIGRTEKATQ
jgi:hypothetical protein